MDGIECGASEVGAAAARGQRLWFLHADSAPAAIARGSILACQAWGFFDVRLDDPAALFRVIEWSMNRRARLTRIATGDQGLFLTRALFARAGGFPPLALMEDITFSARLRALARPCRPQERIGVSTRQR